METQVKDTIYTQDQLNEMAVSANGKTTMQEILASREVDFHHMNKEETLMELILESNPVGEEEEEVIAPVVQESKGIAHVMPQNTGIVLLELIKPKRTGSLRVRDFTGSNGEKKKLRDRNDDPWIFMITKNEKLDMSNDQDRALYEHLKDHPYVTGGGGLDPSIRLINEGQDSVTSVNKRELTIEAQNIVKKLNEEELRNFARICNVLVAHRKSPIVVKDKLYDLCENKPEFVMQMWNDPRKDLRALVYKGQDKGLITKVTGVFRYENLAIGTTEDEMVLWFEKNPDILPGLRNKIKNA